MAARCRELVAGRVLHIGFVKDDMWIVAGCEQRIGLDLFANAQTTVVADANALPFRSGSLDTVLALEVLAHVRRPADVIGEMQRVLAPGGHVLVSVPFVWQTSRTPKDYWRFGRDSLEMLFAEFRSSDIQPLNGARETLMHVLHLYAMVFLASRGWPRSWLRLLNPVERLVYAVIPREHTVDPLWTTGWFVTARV